MRYSKQGLKGQRSSEVESSAFYVKSPSKSWEVAPVTSVPIVLSHDKERKMESAELDSPGYKFQLSHLELCGQRQITSFSLCFYQSDKKEKHLLTSLGCWGN